MGAVVDAALDLDLRHVVDVVAEYRRAYVLKDIPVDKRRGRDVYLCNKVVDGGVGIHIAVLVGRTDLDIRLDIADLVVDEVVRSLYVDPVFFLKHCAVKLCYLAAAGNRFGSGEG